MCPYYSRLISSIIEMKKNEIKLRKRNRWNLVKDYSLYTWAALTKTGLQARSVQTRLPLNNNTANKQDTNKHPWGLRQICFYSQKKWRTCKACSKQFIHLSTVSHLNASVFVWNNLIQIWLVTALSFMPPVANVHSGSHVPCQVFLHVCYRKLQLTSSYCRVAYLSAHMLKCHCHKWVCSIDVQQSVGRLSFSDAAPLWEMLQPVGDTVFLDGWVEGGLRALLYCLNPLSSTILNGWRSAANILASCSSIFLSVGPRQVLHNRGEMSVLFQVLS